MTAPELDLDAIEARVFETTAGPWTAHDDGLVWPPHIGDPVSGSVWLPDARFIAAARTDVPALVAEIRRFQPVPWDADGDRLYMHTCRNVEWWNEDREGPVNEQGCDRCESGPHPNGWRLLYVRDGGA